MIRRILSALILLWVIGFVVFVALLPRPADDEKTDGIIVLTGGGKRIERGLALIEARRAQRLLISGVDRSVKPHELAKEYSAPMRLFDCCVDLGVEAVDTRSNADEAANWVEKGHYKSVRLVTTDWHMPRARFELGQSLPKDVRVLPDAVRSEPDLRVLLTEYNKYLLRRGAVLVGL